MRAGFDRTDILWSLGYRESSIQSLGTVLYTVGLVPKSISGDRAEDNLETRCRVYVMWSPQLTLLHSQRILNPWSPMMPRCWQIEWNECNMQKRPVDVPRILTGRISNVL